MNMPKSRDMHAKIPSPEVILLNFGFVSVKVLNRYDIIITNGISERYGGYTWEREWIMQQKKSIIYW